MPRMTDDTDFKASGSSYGFSGRRVDTLGATEYTLVDVLVDRSGSVDGFQDKLEACLKEVVKSCRSSPRADNLLLRVTLFNGTITEVHGYKPLADINPDDYTGKIHPSGMTALFDASHLAIQAQRTYAAELVKQDFQANGIVVIVTDGDDTASAIGRAQVKDALAEAVKGEVLESLVSVLVGVNVTAPAISDYLKKFKDEAGLTQYVEVDQATDKKIAKLAAFVSKSISAQSQALGSGGPSQAITY